MTHIKLAPRRKRPRRVARKVWTRFGILHHRDVPRGWHCPDCIPIFGLDHAQYDDLTRCMQHAGFGIPVTLTGDLSALDDQPDEPTEAPGQTVYQREWRAIRDDLGETADEQHLAIRLGLELLQEMTNDPLYRAEREHRHRVEEYRREREERRQLLEMDAPERLTYALWKGETSVRLTPEQSRPWADYRCLVIAAPCDPPSYILDDAHDLPALARAGEHTWELTRCANGSVVATIKTASASDPGKTVTQ